MSICQINNQIRYLFMDVLKEKVLKISSFEFLDPDIILRMPIFTKNTNACSE